MRPATPCGCFPCPAGSWTFGSASHARAGDPGTVSRAPAPLLARGRACCSPSAYLALEQGETVEELSVRFRTVGDMTSSAAMESPAVSSTRWSGIEAARTSERGQHMDDRRSESAMEERKAEGYF